MVLIHVVVINITEKFSIEMVWFDSQHDVSQFLKFGLCCCKCCKYIENGPYRTGTDTLWRSNIWCNKANLRDLIAATGLIILLKLDPNHRFFGLCNLEF